MPVSSTPVTATATITVRTTETRIGAQNQHGNATTPVSRLTPSPNQGGTTGWRSNRPSKVSTAVPSTPIESTRDSTITHTQQGETSTSEIAHDQHDEIAPSYLGQPAQREHDDCTMLTIPTSGHTSITDGHQQSVTQYTTFRVTPTPSMPSPTAASTTSLPTPVPLPTMTMNQVAESGFTYFNI